MLETFSQHLQLSSDQVEELLSLSLNDFLSSPQVKELLGSLNTILLKQTLPIAKSILSKRLPAFYNWLKNELGVQRIPDSPRHATTWVVNFLNNQESLTRLIELHKPVPQPALEQSISRLVAAFDGVEDDHVRQEWQKAIAILCLLLVVAARDRVQSEQVVE